MSSVQRVIKYAAIVLAVLIIASMLSLAVSIVTSIIGDFDDDAPKSIKQFDFDAAQINTLYIELDAASLKIERGAALSVTADEERVRVEQNDGKLKIYDKENARKETEVILSLPEMTFSSAYIDMDAGILEIKALSADTLELELGAGDASIDLLNTTKSTDIDAGAGKIVIRDGSLAALDFQLDAGQSEVRARLLGAAEFDCSVGSLELSLIGAKEDYKFEVEKDLGSVSIDGSEISGGTVGDGECTVLLDCDLGSVNVTTGN